MNSKTRFSVLAGCWLYMLALQSFSSAAEVEIGPHRFQVPDGFTIELAAGPPLVERPISAAFDEGGALYVTDSSGDSSKASEQLERRSHRIRRLEDSDGDGVFDKSSLFADRMMFPEGALWLDGSLYVAAPPSIWRLTDTDGDGVADQRQEWLEAKTLTGCANDLHGPYRGLDGWIYWCKGAFAEQSWPRPGKDPFVTRAAHVFRRRPGGGIVEPVMTGGMDNPVDVTFLPNGERFLTTTFLQHPFGGKRDGILHAVYGGVYGKDHGVIEGHPRTGPLMPVLSHLGAGAPCGLATYGHLAFGGEFENNLFACLFNLRKVTRHVLSPAGASWKSEDSDFLVSDSFDFHPTDVIVDADGSLLVIDTGGWYRICCPTAQLQKSDVLGAVYRIRRKDAASLVDPRGRAIDWKNASTEQLVEMLGDSRPAVRDRAIDRLAADRLAASGSKAVSALAVALQVAESPELRTRCVWALTRIDDAAAFAAVRQALRDSDPTVRHAAMHSVAVRRDTEATDDLRRILRGDGPARQRAACEALGRLGDARAVADLFDAVLRAGDRVLDHSARYAIIEIGDAAFLREALASEDPKRQAVALEILEELPGDSLGAEEVLSCLLSRKRPLADAARRVLRNHPEWASKTIAAVREALRDDEVLRRTAREGGLWLHTVLEPLGPTNEVQSHIAESVLEHVRLQGTPGGQLRARNRQSALLLLGRLRPKKLHPRVLEALTLALGSSNLEVQMSVVDTLWSADLSADDSLPLRRAILEYAEGSECGVGMGRVYYRALAAALGRGVRLPDSAFTSAVEVLTARPPALDGEILRETRDAALSVIERCGLGPVRRTALLDRLHLIGPLELPRLFTRLTRGADEASARRLIEELPRSAGFHALRADDVRAWLDAAPPAVQERGRELLSALGPDLEQQQAVLAEIARSLPAGDARRGQSVFNKAETSCTSCHPFGYLGGRIGPDLTRIGQLRSRQSLLGSLVFPSAAIVRGYASETLVLKNGQVHSGIVVEERYPTLRIHTGLNQSVTLDRHDVSTRRPESTSIMPGGLTDALSRQELADLLEFLLSTKG